MSGISSGVGLLSGLPTQSIIDQLIALESRPMLLLQGRVQRIQAQRTAYAELSARLLGLKSTVARFDETQFFRASAAQSSDESVLTATAGEGAAQGTFQFQVRSLVTNHQLLSGGFVDTDRQPVGAGSLSFEIGHGRLDSATALGSLNGGDGVRRGTIEITDSSGDRASIDLTTALTVQDVVSEINANTQIAVQARADGDHLVIEDTAGGSLTVRDLSGGHMAEDLGIVGSSDSGAIAGSAVVFLSDQTQLSVLNDGNGVSAGNVGRDIEITSGTNTFTVSLRGLLEQPTNLDVLNNGNGVRNGTIRITNRAGESAEIVIDDSVESIGDVIGAIESAGIDISVTTGAVAGQLVITDESTPGDSATPHNLTIENVTGQAASDLGIVVDTDQTTFTGSEIHRISTIGDVLRAINFAVDDRDPTNPIHNEDIVASIGSTGRGLSLNSLSGTQFSVASGDERSSAAEELGLLTAPNTTPTNHTGRDVLAGLNTVLLSSLNGGAGVSLGEVKVWDADGDTVIIDFNETPPGPPGSVQAFITRFNTETAAAGVGVTARLNDAGNGILLEDTSGGSGRAQLNDVGSLGGTTVADLFGASEVLATNGVIDSGNAQLQYVSRSSLLEDMNFGRGVNHGRFVITASTGAAVSINIGANQRTVGDVIDFINASAGGVGIEARINAQGDGIEIVDRSGGTGTFKVVDESGTTVARDLNIAGEGSSFEEDGESYERIDGSYEYHLAIDADDTLADVRQKIEDLGIDINASIINDGGGSNPFHLIVSSGVSGTRGQVVVDSGDTDLSFDTLVRAQDAVVFFGGSDAENPIVLTSSTNTLSDVLENVTINLTGTSDAPVELSITRDVDRIVTDLGSFVSSYNGALESIEQHTSFDAETDVRGTLFGENTVNLVQNRLRSAVTGSVPGARDGLDRLILVGVSVGNGGRLSFDEDRFRELYTEDPEAIEALFTTEDTGLGDRLDTMLDDLTRSFDGLLTRRDDLLGGREALFNTRIDALEEQLERKRARLERQFQGLETSLANLQGAQSAVGTLASLAGASVL